VTWTPERLARALHASFGRVTPRFFGYEGRAPEWEEIPEESRRHLTMVCADVLGVGVEREPPRPLARREAVPTAAEFERARVMAHEEAGPSHGLSDWEADLRRQIDEASSRAPQARKGFDGQVR
jgi:hypothetical protein